VEKLIIAVVLMKINKKIGIWIKSNKIIKGLCGIPVNRRCHNHAVKTYQIILPAQHPPHLNQRNGQFPPFL
jgi:hypothetical protein